MRIGIFVHFALSPISAGIGNLVKRLVTALVRLDAGIDYRLICFRGQAPADSWNLPGNARFVELPYPARLTVDGLWQSFHAPCIERWVGPLDLLHLTSTEWAVPTGLPLVVTCHDLFPEHYPTHFKRVARWRRRGALNQIRNQARRIIAVSDHTRKDVIRTLSVESSRVVHIYPGLPMERFDRPAEDEVERVLTRLGLRRPFFLFVGRQDRRKNLHTLLRAFWLLRQREVEDFSLVLAGSRGWRSGALLRAARSLGIRESVHFTGYVSDVDLRCLLASARALVYPSLWEGFGFPTLEAMAAGLPVVASSAGAVPEVVGEAALLHPPEDAAGLAASMERVATDAHLRERLLRSGYARLSRFSWESCARQTLDVYLEALGTRRASLDSAVSSACPAPNADVTMKVDRGQEETSTPI